MKISTHMKNSKKACGAEARDIHEWIDEFFDNRAFALFCWSGIRHNGFNPYDHRKHRHCKEALADAIEHFKDKYPPETVTAVFESHLRDDYRGYLPSRDDFDEEEFERKYHSF